MTQISTQPLIIVTRQDFTAGYQIAQSVHAATEFFTEHPSLASQWKRDSNTVVCLAASDETHLRSIATKLQSKNIDVSLFTEPDLNDQLTAIAISPSREARKMLSYLPKAGVSTGDVCKPKEEARLVA